MEKDVSNPFILRNHSIIKNEMNFDNMGLGNILQLIDMEKLFRLKYFKYVRSISSSDSSTAEKLGLTPSNFYRMCKELGIKT